jgi:hypothetical protein
MHVSIVPRTVRLASFIADNVPGRLGNTDNQLRRGQMDI